MASLGTTSAGVLGATACTANTFSTAGATGCTACPALSSSGVGASTCTCFPGSALSGSGLSLSCTGAGRPPFPLDVAVR